jgi:hypothetical protein
MTTLKKYIDMSQVKLGIYTLTFILALGIIGHLSVPVVTGVINNTANQYNTNYASLTK